MCSNARNTAIEDDDDELGEEEADFEAVAADAANDEEDGVDLLDEGQEESDAAVVAEINAAIEILQDVISSSDSGIFYLSANDIRLARFAVTKVCSLSIIYIFTSLLII